MRQPPAHVPRGPRAALRRAAVAALTCGLVLVSPAALAHDALVGTDPPDGAVLDAAPTQVVLTFSAQQTPVGAEVVVTCADGAAWSDGEAVVSGVTVTQALRPGVPDGPCTVAWRSVAQDGHPVTGSFGFEVAAPRPEPTPSEEEPSPSEEPASVEPTADPTPTEPTPAQEPDGDDDGGVTWWVAAAGFVLAAGTAALLARRRRVGRG